MNVRNCRFLVGLGCIASVSFVHAAFKTDFDADVVGAPPSGWILTGTNSSDSTVLVASESGNKYLAIRDFNESLAANATIQDAFGMEKAGYLQFDIRFNQGVVSPASASFNATVLGTAPTFSLHSDFWNPIMLQFQHPFGNTNLPMLLRSLGNNDYNPVTNDFPIGSWQTIRIDFRDAGNGVPRGSYTVIWNGITNAEVYLDQGEPWLNMDALQFGGFAFLPGDQYNVDIDNIQFIPEPGGRTLLTLSSAVLVLVRRRR